MFFCVSLDKYQCGRVRYRGALLVQGGVFTLTNRTEWAHDANLSSSATATSSLCPAQPSPPAGPCPRRTRCWRLSEPRWPSTTAGRLLRSWMVNYRAQHAATPAREPSATRGELRQMSPVGKSGHGSAAALNYSVANDP